MTNLTETISIFTENGVTFEVIVKTGDKWVDSKGEEVSFFNSPNYEATVVVRRFRHSLGERLHFQAEFNRAGSLMEPYGEWTSDPKTSE